MKELKGSVNSLVADVRYVEAVHALRDAVNEEVAGVVDASVGGELWRAMNRISQNGALVWDGVYLAVWRDAVGVIG
jgi:hypothetical protein